MSLGYDFAEVSSGDLYSTIDTFGLTTGLVAGGPYIPLGSLYFPPNQQQGVLSVAGSGQQNGFRYIRYNPTASVAIGTAPAPVYWKDEGFTTVTPTVSESFTGTPNSFAGWLLYNTTHTPAATAAQINGNCAYIQVGGFLPAAAVPAATAPGDVLVGANGSFTSARVAAGTSPGYAVAGRALTAVVGGVADIHIPLTI